MKMVVRCMEMAVFGENVYIWQASFLPPRMNKVLPPCMQTNIFDSNALDYLHSTMTTLRSFIYLGKPFNIFHNLFSFSPRDSCSNLNATVLKSPSIVIIEVGWLLGRPFVSKNPMEEPSMQASFKSQFWTNCCKNDVFEREMSPSVVSPPMVYYSHCKLVKRAHLLCFIVGLCESHYA